MENDLRYHTCEEHSKEQLSFNYSLEPFYTDQTNLFDQNIHLRWHLIQVEQATVQSWGMQNS